MTSVLSRPHLSTSRSGQSIGIDFAIGLTIFLLTVTLGFIYVNDLASPSNPFSNNIQRSAIDGIEEFKDQNSWTVYQSPTTIETSYTEQFYPVELSYIFPENLDANSTMVLLNGEETRSQTDPFLNETVLYANLSGGEDTAQLIYTRDTSLESRNYSKDVYRSQNEIWNNNINTSIDQDGISNLAINGQSLLSDSSLTSGSATINYTEGYTRATAHLDHAGSTYIRSFGNDNRIRIRQEDGTSSYSFDLNDDISEVYLANYSGSSQTTQINSGGTVYSGRADIADFHDAGGTTYSIGMMHDGMEITVENSSGDITADVTLTTDDTSFLLLPHDGDETTITSEIDLYFDPPTLQTTPTHRKTGLSPYRLTSFSRETTNAIQTLLGLSGLGVNITLPGETSVGQEPPGSQQVSVIERPASILGRFANTTLTEIRISIWL